MTDETASKTTDRILLLLEDDDDQRQLLAETAWHYFGENSDCRILKAKNTNEAVEQLTEAVSTSPDAYLFAVMDYNMGANQPGQRKPIESMFFNATFLKMLENGALIVIYSGYPEQVRQSQVVFEQSEKRENCIVLMAVKSEVSMDDLFRLLKATKKENLGTLNKIAKKVLYDLGKVLEYLKQHK